MTIALSLTVPASQTAITVDTVTHCMTRHSVPTAIPAGWVRLVTMSAFMVHRTPTKQSVTVLKLVTMVSDVISNALEMVSAIRAVQGPASATR